jgi:hypothetical protein
MHFVATNTIRTIIAHVERGFADFAKVPYQDRKQQELLQLLDEFEAECSAEQSGQGGLCDADVKYPTHPSTLRTILATYCPRIWSSYL